MKHATSSVDVTAPKRMSIADLTEDLARAIKDSSVTTGCAIVQCMHTTCALMINEHEDGASDDLMRRLELLVPRDEYYAHDDLGIRTQNLQPEERSNGAAHVAAMILGGTSHAIPIADGEASFGTWQRLLLIELDEPKPRTITFFVFGE